MPPNPDIKEILRLTQENNSMLHSMRRGAFLKTIVHLIFYAVIILAPIWFYMQYMAPVVNQMLTTVQQVQGTGAQAQAQFSGLQDIMKTLAEKLKSVTPPQPPAQN